MSRNNRKKGKAINIKEKPKVYSIKMSVIACIISWASLRFLPDEFHLGALWIVGVFTLIIGAMTLNLARKLYLHYKKDSTTQ